MALMTREDLESRGKYKYTWTVTPGDNPNITGKPDSSRVSRQEGYEVLQVINSVMKQANLTKKHSGEKIEDMIHASDIVMRDKLEAWIILSFNSFKAV